MPEAVVSQSLAGDAQSDTQPTLVVGIGGTGQDIVADVKRALIGAYGRVPDSVRLLAFDLHAFQEESDEEADEQDYFSRIRLERREYVHVAAGGRVSHLRDGVCPWFPKQDYVRTFGDQPFVDGAGRHRPVGRAALYHDLDGHANSRVMGALRDALEGIQSAAGQGEALQVILVSSLVGGTGAGMVTDIAVLLHTFPHPKRLWALLVLPEAWGDKEDENTQNVLARAYATWREFGRMRLTGQAVCPYEFHFPHVGPYLLSEPIVEGLYLVGGKRWGDGTPMNPVGEPRRHAFPAAAQFIFLLMDRRVRLEGQNPESITTLAVNDRDQQMQVAEPLYSAIGVWTERSVVLQAVRGSSMALNRRWLEVVGTPRPHAVEVADGIQVQYFDWAPDQNEEAPGGGVGTPGSRESQRFLASAGEGYGGETAPVTGFVHDIGAVCYSWTDEQKDQVRQTFMGQRGEDGFAELEGRFVGRGRPDDVESFRQETGEKDPALGRPSSRAKGVSKPDAWYNENVRALEEKLDEVYGGGVDSRGRPVPGHYGEALGAVSEDQVRLFAQALRLKLNRLLMGDDATSFVRARKGKPGYALDFLRQLERDLQRYIEFLNWIREERRKPSSGGTGRPLEDEARTARESARETYERVRDRKLPLLGWEFAGIRSKAMKAQDGYRDAVDDWVQVRKEELLLGAMERAAKQMQQLVHNTVLNMQAWQRTLTGDPAMRVQGLYGAVEEEYNQSGVGLIVNRAPEVQEARIPPAAQPDDQLLNQVLERVVWTVTAPADLQAGLGVQLRLRSLVPGRGDQDLLCDAAGVNRQRNLTSLARFSEGVQGDLRQRHRIMPLLQKEFSAEALADRLLPKGRPMLHVQGGVPTVQQWLSVAAANADEESYIEQAVDRLKEDPRFGAMSTRLAGSSDPYTLTYLQVFRGFTARQVASRQAMAETYRAVFARWAGSRNRELAARLMHVLPAEQHAVELELYLREVLGAQAVDELHPRVVACLEDNSKATLFFWACLFGLVKEEALDLGGRALRVKVPVMASGAPHSDLQVTGAPFSIAAQKAGSNLDLWVQGLTNFVNRGRGISLDANGNQVLGRAEPVDYESLLRVVNYYLENTQGLADRVLGALLENVEPFAGWRAQGGPDAGGDPGTREVNRGLFWVSAVLLARDCANRRIDLGLGNEQTEPQLYRARLARLLRGQDPRK